MASFETTSPVFNITHENNSFSITVPSHWISKSAEKTVDELKKLLGLRSPNEIEKHLKEVSKRGCELKIETNNYKLSDRDTQEKKILEETKNVKTNDLEEFGL